MARPRKYTVPEGSLSGVSAAAARLALAVALGIDAYLAWVSWTSGGPVGCGPTSDCHTVLSSRWAYWFGIPVSVPALLLYIGMLAASFSIGPGTAPTRRRLAWQVLIPSAIAVVGAALWFICLQLFVLEAICPYCMSAHGAGLLASFILLLQAPIRSNAGPGGNPSPDAGSVLSPGRAGALALGGIAAAALLVGGQILVVPKTYTSTPVSAGLATNLTAQAAREFQLLDGQFLLNLKEVPVIGPPAATNLVLSLFDYTCHYCRHMHGPLMQASRQFSNSLAIISLPMPLDAKCNPLMRSTPSDHTNACALARIGLIVWRADRAAARQYDDWVFGSTAPPLPAEAEQRARQLVGVDQFEKAANDPWITNQIQQDVAIYKAVYDKYKKSTLPEVIIGTNLISGPFNENRLFELLNQQFGLRMPP